MRFGVKSIKLQRADMGHEQTASWMTKTSSLTGEPAELLFVVNPVTTELQKLLSLIPAKTKQYIKRKMSGHQIKLIPLVILTPTSEKFEVPLMKPVNMISKFQYQIAYCRNYTQPLNYFHTLFAWSHSNLSSVSNTSSGLLTLNTSLAPVINTQKTDSRLIHT